ncbi:MAG TPA: hypothetical protein VK002_11780 [Rubricoccaceae bacterium]|nr:hypothetical protein [Rubricoccaceae bacterium]
MEAGAVAADPTAGVRLRRVPRRFPTALTPAEVDNLVLAVEKGPASVRWLRGVAAFAVHVAAFAAHTAPSTRR